MRPDPEAWYCQWLQQAPSPMSISVARLGLLWSAPLQNLAQYCGWFRPCPPEWAPRGRPASKLSSVVLTRLLPSKLTTRLAVEFDTWVNRGSWASCLFV